MIKHFTKAFFYRMPPSVFVVFALTLGAWLYVAFKKYETYLLPVVTDFKVTEVVRGDNYIRLRGTFDKVRQCAYKEITAYSEGYRVDLDLISYEGKTRVTGHANWGWWEIEPEVRTAHIIIWYECNTGLVGQEVYKGHIKVSK